MPQFHVEKHQFINAPKDDLVTLLSDFSQWIAWSPWLLMEPDATVTIAEDKHHYSWEGQRVGLGNMTLLDIEKHENKAVISYDLQFLKPWKSQASVAFTITQIDDGCKVVWSMESALPFFLFWMKKLMVAFVGMDYQRGLDMLKEHVETGNIASDISFLPLKEVKEVNYVGYKTICKIDDIDASMDALFSDVEAFANEHPDIVAGEMLSIYHKWELTKGIAHYTAALPVRSVPDVLPSNMLVNKIRAHKAIGIRHVGHYKHLGNAWSTLYTMERNKEIKCAKGVEPYEVYMNSPKDTASDALITDIIFPVRA